MENIDCGGEIYKIKDFVYIEDVPDAPYRIACISGFKPGPSSTVLVRCSFYERVRDLDPHWVKKLNGIKEKYIYNCDFYNINFAKRSNVDKEADMHLFGQRELVCDKNQSSESEENFLPASSIRGKCIVERYICAESIYAYINREDAFYYIGSFDDIPKRLLIEGDPVMKKSERLEKCALVKDFEKPSQEYIKEYSKKDVDTLLYSGEKCRINNRDYEIFMRLLHSIGLYGRALDQSQNTCDSSVQYNLAYSFRDSTKFYGLCLLNQCNYIWQQAIRRLFDGDSPIICTDQLELWTESDINIFYEELKKNKSFVDMHRKYPQWKDTKEIVEFYYMNKVTDTYHINQREKNLRKSTIITQIIIPKQHTPLNLSYGSINLPENVNSCSGCQLMNSSYWYPWVTSENLYLCQDCWIYWKKYGGLRVIHDYDGCYFIDSPYRCIYCCVSFTNKRRYIRHNATHSIFTCDIITCSQKFPNYEILNLHKKYFHELIPRIPKCPPTSHSFFFLATDKWKKLRNNYCTNALDLSCLYRRPNIEFHNYMIKSTNKLIINKNKSKNSNKKRTYNKISKNASTTNGQPPSKKRNIKKN